MDSQKNKLTVTFSDGIYWLEKDGKKYWLPRVSWILQDLGISPKFRSPEAAHFGTAVHKACELVDLGSDILEIPEVYRKHALGYQNFLQAFPEETRWLMIEEIVWHDTYGYAGRLDRCSRHLLIDIKTGNPYPFQRLQLAAYAMTRQALELLPKKFALLYLKEDTTFDLHWISDQEMIELKAAWKGCLQAWWFRQKHGLNPSLKSRIGGKS